MGIFDRGDAEVTAHFDCLGYRFERSKRGRLMRLVRPKSKRKLREALKKHPSGILDEDSPAHFTIYDRAWYIRAGRGSPLLVGLLVLSCTAFCSPFDRGFFKSLLL